MHIQPVIKNDFGRKKINVTIQTGFSVIQQKGKNLVIKAKE